MLKKQNKLLFKNLSCALILLICPACTKRQTTHKPVQVQEARAADVAVPLGARLERKSTPRTFSYTSDLPRAELVDFLMRDMERFGWRLLARSGPNAAVLVFDKPNAVCVMRLHDAGRKVKVVTTRMIKQGA